MTSRTELAEISTAVHDEYFDIDRLEYDVDRLELRLPIFRGQWEKRGWGEFGRPPAPSSPPFCILIARGVEEVVVRDEAEVGCYDIGSIEYDAETQALRIISNIPCEIIARCARLDVACVDA